MVKKLIKTDERVCGACKYFCQHYRKWGTAFHPVACGHCRYPRIKQRVKDNNFSGFGHTRENRLL